MPQFTSTIGLFIILGIAWALSTSRKTVNWRLLAWGLGMQLVFALFIFQSDIGQRAFILLNNGVSKGIESANAGPSFLFGKLASSADSGFVLATQALPLIVVFSALVAILYYYGVMQFVIKIFAYVFTRFLRVSGAEGLCAASNIFVGIESTLTIRPHIKNMTRSELCTILTAGMATVASNVIGFYFFLIKDHFPNITGHLVSASFLSAPASLMLSKLLMPETEEPLTLGLHVEPDHEKEENVFTAIINGSNNGLKLMFGIGALLLAVVGLIGVINLVLGSGCHAMGIETKVTLEMILGFLFRPFAFIMGVPWGESKIVGEIIGQRLIATEIPGYIALGDAIKSGAVSPRTAAITAYALCGFAHIPSMAIFVGGTAAIAPERRADLARVAPRALLAANLACLMTGCIAGIFAGDNVILMAQ